jgi:hypothetical protein
VTDGVTCQISIHECCLILPAEVNLSLSRTGQAGPGCQPRCALSSDNAVKPFEVLPYVGIR